MRKPVPVARGTTEGQALVEYLDGVLQIPLGEVQEAKAAVGNDRCGPSTCQRGEAEGLFPVVQTRGEGPKRTQGPRQPGLGTDPPVCTGRARLLSAASTFRRSNSAARLNW